MFVADTTDLQLIVGSRDRGIAPNPLHRVGMAIAFVALVVGLALLSSPLATLALPRGSPRDPAAWRMRASTAARL